MPNSDVQVHWKGWMRMADFATSLPDAYRARRPTTGLNTLSPLYEEPEETPMPEWNMLPSVGTW